MSFDNVLSFDSFEPKTDNNVYNDNARPATHVEYDQSRLLANQELYRDSGVVTFNPSDGGSVNYNGDALAFGVSRRKRYTIILVVIVVVCLCLIAIGLGVGLGVNGHTDKLVDNVPSNQSAATDLQNVTTPSSQETVVIMSTMLPRTTQRSRTPPPRIPSARPPFVCDLTNEMRCTSGGLRRGLSPSSSRYSFCLPLSKVCDKNLDCNDGSDELMCARDQYQVRLVGVTSVSEGRVEITKNNITGTVCGDGWNDNAATVVCRMLGYGVGSSYLRESGTEQRPVWILPNPCQGSESDIRDCRLPGVNRVGNCITSASGYAGVICEGNSTDERDATGMCVPEREMKCVEGLGVGATGNTLNTQCIPLTFVCDGKSDCQDGSDEEACRADQITIALAGAYSSMSGRVEITINNIRGTICDDYWDDADATVICRMLGFGGGIATTQAVTRYSPGRGAIWYDDVRCHGNETNIQDCATFKPRGENDCSHAEDAGVTCSPIVICPPERQMKCPNGRTPSSISTLPSNTDCISLSMVCDGKEDCRGGSDERSCGPVQVAVVGGLSQIQGRVEVTMNNITGTICRDQWDDRDAMVICRMLNYSMGVARSASTFNRATGAIWFNNVMCLGTETDIRTCPLSRVHSCGHYEDAGVVCSSDATPSRGTCEWDKQMICGGGVPKGGREASGSCVPLSSVCDGRLDCMDGSDEAMCAEDQYQVTLVGGVVDTNGHMSNGQVAVTKNNITGSICFNEWDANTAVVVCRMIGYTSGIATSHPENTPAGSVSVIWYTSVRCIGSEEDIRDCALSSPGFTDHNYGYSHYSHAYQSYRYPSTLTYLCPSLAGVHCSVPFTPRPDNSTNLTTTCGVRNVTRRLFVDQLVTYGQFPWQAAIFIKPPMTPSRYSSYTSPHALTLACSGVIIDRYWILTSAHCLNVSLETIRLRVGDHNVAILEPFEKQFRAEKVVIHPEYNRTGAGDNMDYDVALVRIRSTFIYPYIEFNNYVQPACLPTSSVGETDSSYSTEVFCEISGWQLYSYYTSLLSTNVVSILKPSWCRDIYNAFNYTLSDNTFCASRITTSPSAYSYYSSYADNAWPFVCAVNGSFTVVGVPASTRSIKLIYDQYAIPRAYVKVSQVVDWIKSVIAGGNTTSETFMTTQANRQVTRRQGRRQTRFFGAES